MRRALLSVVFVASVALADAKHPNPFLSQAKVFATQGEGDKCLKRLIQAEQKWKWNDKKDRAEIEMYGGICGYLVGETQAAEVSFKNATKIDPKIDLPKELGPGIEQLWAKATGKAVSMSSGTPPPKETPKEPPKEAPKKPPEKVAEAPPKAAPPPPEPPKPYVEKQRPMTADEKLDAQLSSEANAPSVSKKSGRNVVVPVLLGLVGLGAGGGGIFLGLQAKTHEATFKNLDTYYVDAMPLASQAKTEALLTNVLFIGAGVFLAAAIIVLIVSGN